MRPVPVVFLLMALADQLSAAALVLLLWDCSQLQL